MYTIIGGDGREYGPVSAEQLRQWIASGRANGHTRAKAAGSEEWRPLADFPEFIAAVPATVSSAAPSGAAHFDPLDCFSRSWQLLRANFWPFVGVSLLPIVAWIAIKLTLSHSGLQPEFDRDNPLAILRGIYFPTSVLLPLLTTQPLTVGIYYYILKRARGQTAGPADLCAGFTRGYVTVVLSSIALLALICLGFLCLILPGIYLAVAYSFARLAVVDHGCGVWAGLEISRRAITQRWWSYFLLLLLSLVVLLAGIAALGVGVFVALPLVYGAMVYAYLDLTPPTIAAAP